MFDESLKIHILDLSKSESITGTISEIFDRYVHLSKENYIDFSRVDVMIEDWTGWTKLERVTRDIVMCDDFCIVTPSDTYYPTVNDVVICLNKTIVPVYDPNKSTKGFHGEVKYKYKTVPCGNLVNTSEYFRMRKLPRTDAPFYQHIKCDIAKMPADGASEVYQVYTKSGFFNGNNFHLCSSDTRIEDEKELWK